MADASSYQLIGAGLAAIGTGAAAIGVGIASRRRLGAACRSAGRSVGR